LVVNCCEVENGNNVRLAPPLFEGKMTIASMAVKEVKIAEGGEGMGSQ